MEMEFQEIKKNEKNARFQRSHPNRTKRSEFVAIWHQTTQNEKKHFKLKGAKYRTARQMALVGRKFTIATSILNRHLVSWTAADIVESKTLGRGCSQILNTHQFSNYPPLPPCEYMVSIFSY